MVVNGIKQEMDENLFYEMVEVLHQQISYEKLHKEPDEEQTALTMTNH